MPLTIDGGTAEERPKRIEEAQARTPAWLRFLLLGFVAVASIATLRWLLKYSHFGMDIQDESFYLLWMANPYLYDASVSQFGYLYHPLYRLLDGNVAALRQANVLITFGLAVVAAGAVLGMVEPSRRLSLVPRTLLALGLGCAALALFSTWLVTPSYNSLNFQALLVATAGLAWSCSDRASTRFHGHVWVGMGGWLAFMAKPSTAVVLAVFVLLFWLLARKLSLRGLLVSIAAAALLLMGSAWWIDGSVSGFVHRFSAGLEMSGLMGAGHTASNMFRLDGFKLPAMERNIFLLIGALTFASTTLLHCKRTIAMLPGVAMVGGMGLFVILWSAGINSTDLNLGRFHNMLFLCVPIGALCAAVACWMLRRGGPIQTPPHVLLPVLAFPLLTYAFSFGTNGNYWLVSGFAAFFWILPVLVLAPAIENRDPVLSLAPLVLAAQVVTVLVLGNGMERPYRQMQPLRLNDQAVDFGKPGSTLMLSGPSADYIDAATRAAKASGLQPGTPLIDMSGQSPGIVYALQAESPGLAWLIGGLPGSARLVTFALGSVPCERLAMAWVLADPGAPRNLPGEVLAALGADLAGDYHQAGAWMTPPGPARNLEPRRQTLLKPARDPLQAQQACESVRNEGVR